MVSKIESYVLLYLQPPFGQAISKKAGKKVAATPKKGGGGAAGKGKVAKVRIYLIYPVLLTRQEARYVSIGRLEGRFQEEVRRSD